ncbi:RNA polymerase sigma factor [Flagellimonas hymeniacidonis]|uniref:RNA polymerase sigma factor n=1 Tax=Flagellimonas hymeniacidonis TaxID=2603628 RepID=A0A5C8UYL8_9FLAO|nr:RNA polymerase sigma factor [Flagellimonas hymeniacidonis]TXN34264.1 RNA polymerase sigma factor [Flagellimonas hymeniacidonis]
MTTNKETNLIQKIRDGNTHAFSELVDAYKNLVYTLTYRMLGSREEAEEVSQDTFIKIFKSLPHFKGDSKLSTWIYKVAYNTCLDRIKQNKRNKTFVDIDHVKDVAFVSMNNALDKMLQEERKELIKRCLNLLPSNDVGLLTLFYFEEQNLAEMEKTLDIPVSTIKVQLFRARKKFAKVLEENLEKEIFQNYG